MKKLKYVTLLLVMTLLIVRCASKTPEPEATPDVMGGATDITDQVLVEQTPEGDLGAAKTDEFGAVTENEAFAQDSEPIPPPLPEETKVAQNTQPPKEEMPPPAETPSEPMSEPMADDGKPATVTALDFIAGENGGTVVVRTNRGINYTTRRNDKNNQFIVEMQNTIVPRKFRRPYNTKEFSSPIASINAFQSKDNKNQTLLIIQLRGKADPGVTQEGNVINVAALGGGGASSSMAQTGEGENSVPPPQNSEEESFAQPAPSEVASEGDGRIMNKKSFDSFLLGQNKFYGHAINIEVTNQDVKETLKFISEESGMNMVLDEDVSGKVTMKLKKVPWDQALTIILQSKQLGYVRNGSILRIATLKTLAGESTAARQVIDAQKNLQDLRIQIFPLSYAKADEMASQVKDTLSSRGKATADKRTNTLIVTDIPEALSKVKALITKLDTQTPQVLIEAKIIEARDSFQRNFGVNWGAAGSSTLIGQGAGQSPLRITPTLSGDINQSIGTSDPTLALSVGTFDFIGDLTTTLKFMESENMIKIISSPRILALDRVEATIEQTSQFPVTVTTTTATSTTTTTSFQDVKTQLKVKPQITAEGGILLDLSILREIAGTQASTGAREVAKRKADTQVLVENGDTIAIGGIYQADNTLTEQGILGLNKIPIIGWLFKSHKTNNEKNELVMLVTPKIMNKEKAFVKAGESL